MNASSRPKVLVCDDEVQILRALRVILRDAGFESLPASTAEEALDVAAVQHPDAGIIDLVLPDGDGVEVCRRLREWTDMPLIVLSAVGDEDAKARALAAGADDYITKPFSVNELLARVRAALRRASAPEEAEAELIEVGDFRIDVPARIVTVRGQEVRLTPKEFDLLVYLAKHPGKVITHRALLSAVWGSSSVEQPEYLRVFVGHLRKKLDSDESTQRYIITEPWVGYRFEPGD
jgi:two-component system, OmpR family, KDP operon response regulator KdpE